jgi:2-polyprenyl-3-methyl-5-hydroxy-6-metoxy-1,4-benzoquinol methylase
MKFTPETYAYFTDNNISQALVVPFIQTGSEKTIPTRMETLELIIEGKSIIHVGCVGHYPILEESIQQNRWFHKRLIEKSKYCLGLDINADGIDFLKNFGYKDVICLDIVNDLIPKEITNREWDFMLLPEVLEHIENPGLFLRAIKNRFSRYVKRLIITVPNTLRLLYIYHGLFNREFTNSDHCLFFSPYTLGKIVTRSGMHVESLYFCQYNPIRRRWPRLLLKKFPFFRDVILMIVSINYFKE